MEKVIVLTGPSMKVNNAYLVDTLLRADLVDTVVIVKPSTLKWKGRQIWRIGTKKGALAVVDRVRARYMRSRLLGSYRRKFLEERLFPQGREGLKKRLKRVDVIEAETLESEATLKIVKSLQPHVAVQAGVGWIREPLLSLPREGFLSLHHGIMPLIRGMDSILWAYVENRADWIGITLQRLNAGLDKGEILGQAALIPAPGENAYSVIARGTMIGAEMMGNAVEILRRKELTPLPPVGEKGVYRSALTPQAVRRAHQMMREQLTPEVRLSA